MGSCDLQDVQFGFMSKSRGSLMTPIGLGCTFLGGCDGHNLALVTLMGLMVMEVYTRTADTGGGRKGPPLWRVRR